MSEDRNANANAEGAGGHGTEVATLGGGCFWCVEAVFDELRGVSSVESGYAGGHAANPTYEQVCSGATGHAEVVRVTFDPREVSFREILEIFFTAHDPTTLNRQGADVGTQYRSVIYYHDERQREVAEQTIRELNEANIWDGQSSRRSRRSRTTTRPRITTRNTSRAIRGRATAAPSSRPRWRSSASASATG